MVTIKKGMIDINTIYSDRPDVNTGNDELCEISKEMVKYVNEQGQIIKKFNESRMLIKLSPLIESSDKIILELFKCNMTNDDNEIIKFKIHDLPAHFDKGTGKYSYNNLNSDWMGSLDPISGNYANNEFFTYIGASWNNNKNEKVKLEPGHVINSSYSIWDGGIIQDDNSTHYWPNWNNSTIWYGNSDMHIDITDYITNTIADPENERRGLLLKIDGSPKSKISTTFYNVNSTTIYKPRLLIFKNDFVNEPPILDFLDLTNEIDTTLVLSNCKAKYRENETMVIRVYPRNKYNLKDVNVSRWTKPPVMFHTRLMYSVVDYHTNETIIPFDDIFTRISIDPKGNYFKLNLSDFSKNRFYKIMIKNIITNELFDPNSIFKVI